MKTPVVNPIQFVIAFIAIFYFMFMETEIYQGLPDIVKILYYAVPIVLGFLFGINLISYQELAKKIVEIFKDKTMSPEEKAEAMFDLAEEALINGKLFLKKATSDS